MEEMPFKCKAITNFNASQMPSFSNSESQRQDPSDFIIFPKWTFKGQ